MTTPSPNRIDAPTTAPATPGGDPTRALLERNLHILGDLAEAGLVMARAVAREAEAAPRGRAESPGVVADLALAFDRVSRAVRHTVALRGRLSEELRAWERAQASRAEMEAYRARAAREAERRARKAQIARLLTRVIAADHAGDDDTETQERRVREASERLRDDDRLGDILDLPVSEAVDRICRDLGIRPDWLRLSEEAWARGEVSSGKVGAALAAAALSATGLAATAPAGAPPEAGSPRGASARPSWRPPARAAGPPRRRRATG